MRSIKKLETLGLDEKEARTYVATLELGNSTAFKIADKSGLAKSTTHDILRELSSRGLISSYMKGNKKYFAASDPLILIEKIKKQTAIAQEVLPELQSIYNARSHKPRVRYYDEVSGIDIATKEFLSEADEMLVLNGSEYLEDALPKHFPRIIRDRIKKGVRSRSIYVEGEKAREYQSKDSVSLRTSKIISKEYDFSTLFWAWNDKVAFINSKGNISTLIIEDKEVAYFLRQLFKYVWDHEQ